MTAPKVRADHEALKQIAKSFAARSDSTAKITQNVKAKMGVLQGGDWVGKGATKFYNEMNSAVLPSLNRSAAALAQAAIVTGKISLLMREAEREAAGLFREDGGGGDHQHDHEHILGDERNKGASSDDSGGSGWFDWLWGNKARGPEPEPVNVGEMALTINRNIAIQKWMDQDKAREAIAEAINQYGYDVSNVKNGQVEFGFDTKGEGITDPDGAVRIGTDAFLKSPGWLISSIGHEIVHANQIKLGTYIDTKQGEIINELEAYDWEIRNANKHGLTEAELTTLRNRREKYYNKLTDENKVLVDQLNYWPS